MAAVNEYPYRTFSDKLLTEVISQVDQFPCLRQNSYDSRKHAATHFINDLELREPIITT